MTRTEHMQWAKTRALAYLPKEPQNAVASMLSDLGKHPETAPLVAGPLGMLGLMSCGSADEARRFIEGFN